MKEIVLVFNYQGTLGDAFNKMKDFLEEDFEIRFGKQNIGCYIEIKKKLKFAFILLYNEDIYLIGRRDAIIVRSADDFFREKIDREKFFYTLSHLLLSSIIENGEEE